MGIFANIIKGVFSLTGSLLKAGGVAIGGSISEWAGKKIEKLGDWVKGRADGDDSTNYTGVYAENVIKNNPQTGFSSLVKQRQALESAEKRNIVTTVNQGFGTRLRNIRKEAAKDLNNIYASPQKRIFNSGHGLMENVSIAAQVQELSDNEINKAARRFGTDHPDLYISGGQVSSGMGGSSSVSYSPVSAATTDAGKETQDIVNKGLNSQLNAIREMNQSAVKGTETALNSFSQSNSANLNKILSATILTNENINQNIKANFQKGNSITVQGFEGLNSQAIKLGSDLEDSIQEGNRRLAQTNEKSFQTLSDQLYQNELAAAEAHEAEMGELAKSKSSFNQLVDLTSIQQTSVENLALSLQGIKAQGEGWKNWRDQIDEKTKEWEDKFMNQLSTFIGKYIGLTALSGAMVIKGIEGIEEAIPTVFNQISSWTVWGFNQMRHLINVILPESWDMPDIDAKDYMISDSNQHPLSSKMKGILESGLRLIGLPNIDSLLPGGEDLWEPVSNAFNYLKDAYAKDREFTFSALHKTEKLEEAFVDSGSFNVRYKMVDAKGSRTEFDTLHEFLDKKDNAKKIYGNITDQEHLFLRETVDTLRKLADGPLKLDAIIQTLQEVLRDFIVQERKNNPNSSDQSILEKLGVDSEKSNAIVSGVITRLSKNYPNLKEYLKGGKGTDYKGLLFDLLYRISKRKEILQDALSGLENSARITEANNAKERKEKMALTDATTMESQKQAKFQAKMKETTVTAEIVKEQPDTQPKKKPQVKATAATNKQIKTKSFNAGNLTSEQIKEIEGKLQIQMATNSPDSREYQEAEQRLEAFRAFLNGKGKFFDGSLTETRPKQQPNVTVNQTNVVQKVTYSGLKQNKH